MLPRADEGGPQHTRTLSADQLLAKAMMAMPDASLRKYLPPWPRIRAPSLSSASRVMELTCSWIPPAAPLLGTRITSEPAGRWRALHADSADRHHGDRLIEPAAGWGIVLLVSGLYLWWPRKAWRRRHPLAQGGPEGTPLVAGPARGGRLLGRRLPAAAALSGNDLTGFWGSGFANLWNRFPAAMWNEVPKSGPPTRSLNHAHEQTVPLGQRPCPMPSSPTQARRATTTAP